MGVAELRRDGAEAIGSNLECFAGSDSTQSATVQSFLGFVSVESMLTGQPGTLRTRPLIFGAAQRHLFVNAVVQPGGFLQARRSPPSPLCYYHHVVLRSRRPKWLSICPSGWL